MHNNIFAPATSKRLGEVLPDIDKWEGALNSFYRLGGTTIPDMTKVMIAMGTLPARTNTSIRLALKGITDYAVFKDTLQDNVRFLESMEEHPDRQTSPKTPTSMSPNQQEATRSKRKLIWKLSSRKPST